MEKGILENLISASQLFSRAYSDFMANAPGLTIETGPGNPICAKRVKDEMMNLSKLRDKIVFLADSALTIADTVYESLNLLEEEDKTLTKEK